MYILCSTYLYLPELCPNYNKCIFSAVYLYLPELCPNYNNMYILCSISLSLNHTSISFKFGLISKFILSRTLNYTKRNLWFSLNLETSPGPNFISFLKWIFKDKLWKKGFNVNWNDGCMRNYECKNLKRRYIYTFIDIHILLHFKMKIKPLNNFQVFPNCKPRCARSYTKSSNVLLITPLPLSKHVVFFECICLGL